MSVLTLNSVCQFCLNEQLEMRNGCSGFAAASRCTRLTLNLEPQDKNGYTANCDVTVS